jgi:hypothetical protein
VIAAAALLVCILRAACVPAWANDDDPHAILFSGRDIWLNGAFAHGGFLFAPSGLDQDGLLLKILFQAGSTATTRKTSGVNRLSAPKDSHMFSAGGGSKAAMRNSNSSSDPNSRNIISCRTVRQIDCVAADAGIRPNRNIR